MDRCFLILVGDKGQQVDRLFRQALLLPVHGQIPILSAEPTSFITLSHSLSQWLQEGFFTQKRVTLEKLKSSMRMAGTNALPVSEVTASAGAV